MPSTDELIVGGTAEGASTRDFPVLLRNLLGVKFKIVAGYTGSREINLAIEKRRGAGRLRPDLVERGGHLSALVSRRHRQGAGARTRKATPRSTQQGMSAHARVRRTPSRQMLELIYSQTAFGRPYVVAPEVPRERVAHCARRSMRTMRDPSSWRSRPDQLDVSPLAGEELQRLIAALLPRRPRSSRWRAGAVLKQ